MDSQEQNISESKDSSLGYEKRKSFLSVYKKRFFVFIFIVLLLISIVIASSYYDIKQFEKKNLNDEYSRDIQNNQNEKLLATNTNTEEFTPADFAYDTSIEEPLPEPSNKRVNTHTDFSDNLNCRYLIYFNSLTIKFINNQNYDDELSVLLNSQFINKSLSNILGLFQKYSVVSKKLDKNLIFPIRYQLLSKFIKIEKLTPIHYQIQDLRKKILYDLTQLEFNNF
ncbi:hypothetical protein [Rickettsia endosymbiont of Cardiosporidium cionae]|uniref:hypothetical protein n=1 Tax=Rickettsia endosymbiont of Cardiosporidium cionae TaxID=2777155 RepID=UPI0018950EF6|nr:hypothetical protein [Rickettsia endosymbiont of Cardiosporidium cionae]KAF8818426.1 hypothetical protein IHI24_000516 [Rickettsia endosymbiont of Cardiosporidium cionae]